MAKETTTEKTRVVGLIIALAFILGAVIVMALAHNWAAVIWAVATGLLITEVHIVAKGYNKAIDNLQEDLQKTELVAAEALNDLNKKYETERDKRQALDNEYQKLVKEHEKTLKVSAASVPAADEQKKTAKKKTVSQVKTSVKKVEEDLKS